MRKFVLILLIAVASPRWVYAADDASSVRLLVGRSTVVDVGTPIARVSLTSADVADAVVTSANQPPSVPSPPHVGPRSSQRAT